MNWVKQRALWLGLGVFLLLPMPSGFSAQDRNEQTRQAITRAVDFLAHTQEPDGSFLYYRCRTPEMTECIRFCSPPSQRRTPDSPIYSSLPTAVVLAGLMAIDDPRAEAVVERGMRFVHAQIDEQGFFGFYPMVEPDVGPQCVGELRQLYATALNRSLLEAYGMTLPPMTPDLATYQTSEGVFYPYPIPPAEVDALQAGGIARARFQQQHQPLVQIVGEEFVEHTDIVDPVVNAMIFDYVVRHGQTPLALCDYLVQTVQQEQTPTHPAFLRNPYLFAYTLSRAYAHGATCLEPARAVLQPRLLQRQSEGSWGNVIETALAANALMGFGYEGEALDRAIQHLLAQQQPDGSWKAAAWWAVHRWLLEPVDRWLGSEAISTGHVLEALGHYLKIQRTTTLANGEAVMGGVNEGRGG